MARWETHLIFCMMYFWVCESLESVEQNSRAQTAFEGRSVTINCTYETSDPSPYLFWYQQKRNGIPKYMMMIVATNVLNDKDFEERFTANHNKTSRSVPLTIQDVCVSDSAVYYCALRTGGNKLIFGEGTQVHVEAKQKEDPAYYKLDDSCLATDFTNHSDVKFSGAAPVRYSGKDYQNYYSSFALREENCPETGDCKEGSSGQSRDIERDEKINFISLGLFWLRILFLKTVVFNLLMTFKAWMS